jgi:hypothetical protein
MRCMRLRVEVFQGLLAGRWRGWNSASLLRALVYVALVGAAVPAAAKDEWIALQAPQFGVVSQLSEKETRRVAGEFAQFIEALQRLYAIDQLALPPLTMVLFERPKAFAPYRPHTESGQARSVEGLFGRRANWSVIGMTGRRGSEATRRVIQHEAVHWFFSANPVEQPLWFAEGFAEVFSTFEVKDGKGRWGEAIPEHVAYLSQLRPQPLETFFSVSQDEALHENKRFYPQAWAFVHYALFGDRGARQAALAEFLKRLQHESRAAAFTAAFGQTYEEVDRALRRYLEGGKYAMAVVDLPDRSGEFTVRPASSDQVDFALGRLALVGANLDLARQHADALIARAPDRPEGYEIRAQALVQAGEEAAAQSAIALAIERDTQDAGLYQLEALLRINAHYRQEAWPDQALDPAVARQIADTVTRSLAMQLRNPPLFETLAAALLNVTELTEQDAAVLDAGQRLLPRSGLMPLVRAAAANRQGDLGTARQLLREARSEHRELPASFRLATARLGERWVVDALSALIANAVDLDELDTFDALLLAERDQPDQSQRLQQALRQLEIDSRVYRRHLAAVAAIEDGDLQTARAHWQAIVDDPDAAKSAKVSAERSMRSLAN